MTGKNRLRSFPRSLPGGIRQTRLRHDAKVPAIGWDRANVAADMAVAAVLGGQKIAGPRVEAFVEEGIAHDAGILAADEHAERGANSHHASTNANCSRKARSASAGVQYCRVMPSFGPGS